MAGSESIFTWEGISLPSYWGGNFQSTGGLAAMDLIRANGANTITLIPNFFQSTGTSNDVHLNASPVPTEPWRGESDGFPQVLQAIQDAKARGLNVVLKPHVERDDRNTTTEDAWRAKIAPSDPLQWFESYKNMMVEYAKVAQAGGASAFVIGTEMRSMTDPTKICANGQTYTQKWIEIIDAVRAVFSGKVTYAATDDEALKIQFWNKLDYIGVDAYFSMAPDGTYNPTLEQLIDSWIKPPVNWNSKAVYGSTSVVDTWKNLSETWDKKVIFTEIGYGSYNGTNLSPGWLIHTNGTDTEEQRLCYEALYYVMKNYGGRWLDGSFIWSYQTTTDPVYVPPTDYTTQGKPADAVIKAGYSSPDHVTGIAWNGTSGVDRFDGGYNNDTLDGGADNDILWGGAGDDLFIGGAGNDVIDGYTGNDTAVFSGRLTDYSIVQQADGSIAVSDKRTVGDDTDQLKNIKYAQFSDQTVELSTVTALPSVQFATGSLSLSKSEGNGGGWTEYVFTLTRDITTGASTVAWSLAAAAPGNGFDLNDVENMSGTVTFTAGSPTATITVRVRADAAIESNEAFTITLGTTTGGNASIGTNGTATGTIVTDDVASAGMPEVFLDPSRAKTPTLDTDGSVHPFAGLTFADAENDVLTVTITFAKDNGALIVPPGLSQFFDYTNGVSTTDGTKVYTFTGKAAELGVIMDILQFDAASRPGATAGSVQKTTFTIAVTDAAHASTSAVQSVEVASVVAKSGFTTGTSTASIAELSESGAKVGTLLGHDDEGHALTYSLAGDGAGGRFKLATESGVTKIVVDNGFLLDFEQARSHVVKVNVHVDGVGDFVQDLIIAVSDVTPEITAGSTGHDLFKGGAGHDRLGGGLGNDKIWGGAGNDTLSGGADNDVLYGGTGSDKFVFDTAPNSKSNKDSIKDWSAKYDTIQLENAIFTSLKKTGTLSKSFFVKGAKALDGNDYVGYNSKTGDLWYDPNGNKAGGQVVFANIGKHKMIAYNDFAVI